MKKYLLLAALPLGLCTGAGASRVFDSDCISTVGSTFVSNSQTGGTIKAHGVVDCRHAGTGCSFSVKLEVRKGASGPHVTGSPKIDNFDGVCNTASNYGDVTLSPGSGTYNVTSGLYAGSNATGTAISTDSDTYSF
jgi:hypothetical protein